MQGSSACCFVEEWGSWICFCPFFPTLNSVCISQQTKVLNLITSFIVEATLASSVDAKDRRTKERQILDKLVMAAFKSFVGRADEDHSGYIDHSELAQ
eukprot:4327793-Amphidinium_carterae.2